MAKESIPRDTSTSEEMLARIRRERIRRNRKAWDDRKRLPIKEVSQSLVQEKKALLSLNEEPFIGVKRDAASVGAKYYVSTGVRQTCVRGHHPIIRRTSNSICVECDRENWEANKHTRNAKRAVYFAEHRDKQRVQNYKRYRKNREYYLQKQKEYAAANRDAVRAKDIGWREANKEKLAAYYAEWRLTNIEAARAKAENRRARKINAGGSHTAHDIKELYALQHGVCVYCPTELGKHYHIDHRMPLARGGSNGRENIQLLCVPCNKRKGAKHPDEFEAEIATRQAA